MPDIAARMAKRLLPAARALGLDDVGLCRATGIDLVTLEDAYGRVELDRTLDFIDALLAKTDAASLGLMFATTGPPDAYHTPALVMLASETLRDGFTRAFELQRLWGDGDRFALATVDGASAVTFQVPGTRRAAHEPLEVCALAETLLAVRGLTGRMDEVPVALGLPSLGAASEMVSSFFGIAPRLGVDRAFIALSADALDAPIPTAHALFQSIFEKQAREELEALPAEDDLVARVRDFVGRGLAAGSFGLERCAGALAMSTRTLERRLSDLGTTYAAEVEHVRKERASRFLREGRPIDEVAALLGYSERASLHRACVRWFDRTPGQLRDG
ncbi:MAG: helix-turn-helix domain-containing protein [Polyangiaceae bacterium]|nr:helix-turn-helix domain-containing protein [Polyangiaceae bacterium]